ncbi:MAG: hypothetical protein J6A37_11750 [Oscillospiraceae bacterium]|nr:hypothetical protein [Oscillospiraceae bacterium]
MAIKKRDNSDSRIASLRVQDKEYNELYRKWRIDHKKDYGFYFLDNSDELTYRDGEGFITESPEAGERSAFTEIHSLLAKFLLIYTLLNYFDWFMANIVPALGDSVPFFYDLLRFISSSEQLSVAYDYITKILIRVPPLFYLLSKVRMPKKIILTSKIRNKPLFNICVPMALLTFAIATLLSNVQYVAASFMGVNPNHYLWIPIDGTCRRLIILLIVVIIPILSETVHHGILLQILKQFGDEYALILTSVIAALTTENYNSFLFIFTVMLVTGFFVVRSGSILTGFLMRIIISGGVYFLTALRDSGVPYGTYITITAATLLICIIIGFTAVTSFILRHSGKISLPLYKMYLDSRERLMCCLSNPTVIMWLTLTFTLMILKVKLL